MKPLAISISLFIFSFNIPRVSLADGAAGTLVIDTSGSLKKADPDGLRNAAFELFLYIMGLQSAQYSCGIIHFSSEARVIQPLTVIDAGTFEQLKAQLEKPGSEGATEIGLGLEAAYQRLVQANQDLRYVILMSDGELYASRLRPQLDRHKAAYDELINEVLPRYVTTKIPIFTICLRRGESQGEPGLPTGEQLLKEIANQTGGQAYRAHAAEDLAEIFKEIRYRLLKPADVAVTDEAGGFWKGSNDEAVYVVGDQDIVIHGPEGQVYTEHDNHPESLFNTIGRHQVGLLKKTPPGEYRVKDLKGQPLHGVEVDTISDVFLIWQRPISKRYAPNEVIPIKTKLNKTLPLPEGTTCVAKIWRPGEKRPRTVELSPDTDGSYAGVFSDTDVAGKYQLLLELISPKLYLRRTLRTEFEVDAKPWFSYEIENTHPKQHDIYYKGDTARLVVTTTENSPPLESLDVNAHILKPKGKAQHLQLTPRPEKKEHFGVTDPFQKLGKHTVILQASGRCLSSPMILASAPGAPPPPTRDFLVQFTDVIPVQESLSQQMVRWAIWGLIFAAVLLVATVVWWHISPTPIGLVEVMR